MSQSTAVDLRSAALPNPAPLEIVVGRIHSDDILSMDRHPQGRLLVTAGGRRVLLWDLPSRMPVRALPVGAGTMKWVRFTNGGEDLLGLGCAANGNCELLRWQIASGKLVSSQVVPLRSYEKTAVSMDGAWFLGHRDLGDKSIRFYDTASVQVKRVVTRRGAPLRVMAAGRECVVLGLDDGAIEVYPSGADTLLRLGGNGQRVVAVATDPECRLVVSATQDGSIRLWRPGQQLEATLVSTEKLGSKPHLLLDAQGQRLACLGEREISVFDLVTPKPLRTVQTVRAASALFVDAQTLAVGDASQSLKFFDLASDQGQHPPKREFYERVDAQTSLGFSKDGAALLGAGRDGLGSQVLAWSAAGARSAHRFLFDNNLVFFQARTGLGSIARPRLSAKQYEAAAVALSGPEPAEGKPTPGITEALAGNPIYPLQDGNRVLLHSLVEGRFLLVDTRAHRLLDPPPFTLPLFETGAVATHIQGRLVARMVPAKDYSLASPRFEVQIWDTEPWRRHTRIVVGHDPADVVIAPFGMGFSPSGAVLSIYSGGRVSLFSAHSGTPVGSAVRFADPVQAGPAFTPDEQVYVVATSRELMAVEAASGKVRWRAPLDGWGTSAIAIHPRLPLVATGGPEGEVVFFSLKNGEQQLRVRAFHTSSDIRDESTEAWVAVAPDGRIETSPEGARMVSASRGLVPVPPAELATHFTSGLLAALFHGSSPQPAVVELQARFLVASPAEVRTPLLPVTLAAEHPSGKIGKIALTVNDRLAFTVVREPSGPTVLTWTAAVALRPGKNTLRLLARDDHDLPSPTAELSVTYVPPVAQSIELVPQIGHQDWVNGVAFSPSGELLATASPDRTVRLWQIRSGLLLGTLSGCRSGWREALAFAPDGRQLAMHVVGDNEAPDALCIWDVVSRTLLRTHVGNVRDVRPEWLPSSGSSAASPTVAKVSSSGASWRAEMKDHVVQVVSESSERVLAVFPQTGSALAFSPDGALLAQAGRDQIDVYSTNDWKQIYAIRLIARPPLDLRWPRPGRVILMRRGSTVLGYSLDTGRAEVMDQDDIQDWQGKNPDGYSGMEVAPDGSWRALGRWGNLRLSPSAGPSRQARSIDFTKTGDHYPNHLRTGLTGSHLAGLTTNSGKEILLYEVASGIQRRFAVAQPTAGIKALAFDAQETILYAGALLPIYRKNAMYDLGSPPGNGFSRPELVATENRSSVLLRYAMASPETPRETRLDNCGITALDAHPLRPWLAIGCSDGSSMIWHTGEQRSLRSLPAHSDAVLTLAFSPDGRRLATASTSGAVHILDSDSGTLLHTPWGHDSAVYALAWAPDSLRLVTASFDGTLRLWGDKGEAQALIIFSGESDALTALPSGVYLGSKSAARGVAFRSRDSVVPFEDYDLAKNRPHEVLKALRSHDQALVQLYEEAFRQRPGNEQRGDEPVPARPQVRVLSSQLQDNELALRVAVGGGARVLHLRVNDVPLPDVPVPTGSQELAVPPILLLQGRNRIRLTAGDEGGRLSLTQPLEVTQEAPAPVRTLYLLAVGVSNYDDPKHHLNAPVHDIAELVKTFSALAGPQSFFSRVKARALPDAGRQDIMTAAREQFRDALPGDVVVLHIAGHGMSSQGRYLFAPRDMDFQKPQAHGMSFEDLEALLSGSPARQRLLLMDTCHSGPIDPAARQGGPRQPLTAQARDPESLLETTEATTAFEAMRTLFADLARGQGALVLAAATGQQSAYEKEEYGFFTHELVKALADGTADLNHNGVITVSELQTAVASAVRRRLGDAQTPTFRRDPLDNDFVLARTSGLLAEGQAPPDSKLHGLLAGGTQLVTRSPGKQLLVWDLRDLYLARRIAPREAKNNREGMSPDEQYELASRESGNHRFIDVEDRVQGRVLGSVPADGLFIDLYDMGFQAFSMQSGRVIFSVSSRPLVGTPVVLSLREPHIVRRFPANEASVALRLSRDGKRAAGIWTLRDFQLRVYEVDSGRLLGKFSPPANVELFTEATNEELTQAAILLEDRTSRNRTIQLRAFPGATFQREFSVSKDAQALAINQRQLAVGAADGSLDLFELSSGRRLGSYKTVRAGARSLLFLPDGSLLSLGDDGVLRRWASP